MLKRIMRLPEFIANQIAAGEVIERPASVVKELLENAFDAKATQVSVDIGFGGLNSIKISDNGTGILAEDLPLALAPHATSKINALSDLYAIQSMGFRGEALASIASVSRLVIQSKPASQAHAMRIERIHDALQCSPCARSQGTTVEVQDIFYNAPVRKKFLKSERGEFQAIESMVRRAAMSAPTVALSLTHNKQLQWQVNPATCDASMRARITKLLGKKFIDGASYLDVTHAGMRLWGWLGDINYQRSQNDCMWVYLNNRMIKDKLLHHAIKQAYAAVLHPGRYPLCLLYLTVDPELVDINVHPTKHEVRFQQARLVHDFMVSQLSAVIEVQALERQPLSLDSVDDIELGALSLANTGLTHFENTPRISALQPNPRQVNALYQYEPASLKYSAQSASLKSQWASSLYAIDKQFSLIFVIDRVYLADLQALRAAWLLDYLHREPRPWAPRPLLVPVYYSDAAFDPDVYSEQNALLKQLGIELDNVIEGKLRVRSIPGVTPQLDIQLFLSAVFNQESSTLPGLLALIADQVSQQQETLSFSQQEDFLNYLTQNTPELIEKRVVKKLSPAVCQELLHG